MLNPPIIGDPVPAGYLLRPDYSRTAFEVPPDIRRRMQDKLGRIYGAEAGDAAFREIERLMQVFSAHKEPAAMEAGQQCRAADRLTEKDAVLIAYGDMMRDGQTPPLEHLTRLPGIFWKAPSAASTSSPFSLTPRTAAFRSWISSRWIQRSGAGRTLRSSKAGSN